MVPVATRRRGSSNAAGRRQHLDLRDAAHRPPRSFPPHRHGGSRKNSSGVGSAIETRIAAVCFDLDGVLILTMPLHARAWREALAPHGVRVSSREIYAWEGEPGRITARTLLRRAKKRPTRESIAGVLHAKERRFTHLARHIRIVPSFRRLLRRLAARGVALALVTGTSHAEAHRVVPGDVRKLFRVIITGDRIRHGKPHPEPYRRAMRALALPPARTLVVENAPYGIRSARRARAGQIVALASSLPPRYLREADVILRSPAEVIRMLDRLTKPD